MLSICTLKSPSQASQYYQSESYYSKDGESPYSQWLGKGSQKLGLEDSINEQDFKSLLEGYSPTGEKLITGTNGQSHRPGYDLTFSAPKSVSIMGIVGDDNRVMEAHRNAVKKVINKIESEFAAYRAKNNSQLNIEKTGNFVVAAFEHTDSRALDPNLHTHCVLMNLTQREDGVWRTIFGDELYNNKLINGMQYRAFLAEELMQKGFNVVQTSNKGTFELEGFEKELINQFSKRRQQITQKLDEVGFSGGKAASIANFETRADKQDVDLNDLKSHWAKELSDCGYSMDWLNKYSQASLDRGPISRENPIIVAEKAINSALNHLSEQQAVFNLNQIIDTARGMTILPCAEADLLKITENRVSESGLLYVGEGLFTTQKARNLEMDTAINIKQGKNQVQAITSHLQASIHSFFSSGTESHKQTLKQALTVKDREILISCQSKNRLNDFISDYQQSCKESKFYPVGLTQSGANVEKFKRNTGLERVNTIEGFIRACEFRSEKINHKMADAGKAYRAKGVWIVDNNVSLKQINELQNYSKQFGARIVWTQGGGKSSPGLNSLIKSGISSCIINQSREDIQDKLNNHQLLKNINKLEEQQKVIKVSKKDDLNQKTVEAYTTNKQSDSIVITGNNNQRTFINSQVRKHLKQSGHISLESKQVEILHPISLTTEQKRFSHYYQLGDVLRFNRELKNESIEKDSYHKIENIDVKYGFVEILDKSGNKTVIEPHQIDTKNINVFRPEKREINLGDTIIWTKTIKHDSQKSLNMTNGERAKVLAFEGSLVSVKLQNGKITQLDLSRNDNKHWDYGHAITLGKSLQSFDNGIVMLDGENGINKSLLNNLSSTIQSIDNIQLVANNLDKIKDNIQKINPDLALARDNKPAFYQQQKVISEQEKYINQSYFPKLESVGHKFNPNHQTREKNHQFSQEQIQKACLIIDHICSSLSEREAVFSLESAKKIVFLQSDLTLSRELIDVGFSKAIQGGFLLEINENSGSKNRLITTCGTLLTEKNCIDLMQKGQQTLEPISPVQALNSIKNHQKLTEGQKQAVELILTTQDRVVGVQGVAGSGKTTMLKEVKRMAEDAGFRIIGLSNTASASNRMTEATTTLDSAGIQAMTTAKFLNLAPKGDFGKNSLIILDEASLTSNKDMHQLLAITDKLEARLVLVGDVKQMGAIEAGKPFYLLLGQGMKSACMTENVRFKNPETLKIMQDLYAARVSDAIDKLADNIIEIPDKNERLTKMAEDYLAKSKEQQAQTLMITPLNEDRLFVNKQIRQGLIHAGQLQGTSYSGHNLIQKDLRLAEKKQIYSYDLGDFVRFNGSNLRDGIEAGSYAKVIKQDFKSHTLTLSNEQGKSFIWSPERNISYEGAVEIYRQESRDLMAGDKIIWRLNDEKKGIFNGNILEVNKINGSNIELTTQDSKILNLNLEEKKNQHWDYAYAVTLPVSQGRDIPFTLGHGESPKPHQKSITELKIGDTVVLPKHQENSHSRIVKIAEIKQDKIIFANRKGEKYELSSHAAQSKKWDYYPPFSERKAHELPKSTSLNGFLVEATRGDNVKMYVDNIDYFRQTLEAHQSIKQSALEHFEPNWQKISASVNAMTAKITGKALPEIALKSTINKPKIDKNKVIDTLHRDVLGYATVWKGAPQKVSHREARWGKNGSFSLIIKGEKAGSWCDFEKGEAGRDLIGLYMTTHGVTFKQALTELVKESKNVQFEAQKLTQNYDKSKQEEQLSNQKKIAYAQYVYQKTTTIHGTPAEKYLANRGLKAPFPSDFRYTANAIHPDTKKPTHSLIIPIKNKNNDITGVVRIFLNKDGTKINQGLTKANLGVVKNAAVAIQNNPVGNTLLVAEGVETALSIAKTQPNKTVVASLSVSQLKNIPVGPSIDNIIICADNDGANPNSKKALIAAISHHLQSGKRVFIAMPEGDKKIDFNDILKTEGEAKVLSTLQNKVEIFHAKQLESNEPRLNVTLQKIREENAITPSFSPQKAPIKLIKNTASGIER